MPQDAMPIYGKHIDEGRKFFASPATFYTALKRARATHLEQYCPECTDAVHFV